ncbi:MAG: methyltransferase domain-containing protein [Desulfobacteraceae bacterium]|nr:methyltransferase domain-containing protein [Desulfobacteraceae bacterium]
MDTLQWNPGTLLEMSGSYWKTFTLHTGVKLDIFTIIGDGQMACRTICDQLNADTKGMATLLNALSAMGLLVKKGDQYANSEVAKDYLSKKSKSYIGYMLMHHHHLVETWFQMDKAVLSGNHIPKGTAFTKEERRENFLMGMFNTAMFTAPSLSETLDLSHSKRLIDIGGGPGTFAIHFCLANPALAASVYDLETTRPFAEKTIEQFSLSDRIDFICGNYIENDALTPQDYDAAWLSHILHGEGPGDAQKIVKKAVDCLKPGGKIFIHDFFLNQNMDGPLFPALFSLNMLINTENGQSYSENQVFEMLGKNGVKDIRRLDFTGPTQSGIICGTI